MLPRVRTIIAVSAALAVGFAAVSAAGTERVVNGKCNGQAATITGTNGPDNLVSGPESDIIAGRGGRDRISGRSGFDVICGGGGDDILLGGEHNDTIFGDRGNDFLKGGPGRDRLVGGPGRDRERK